MLKINSKIDNNKSISKYLEGVGIYSRIFGPTINRIWNPKTRKTLKKQ